MYSTNVQTEWVSKFINDDRRIGMWLQLVGKFIIMIPVTSIKSIKDDRDQGLFLISLFAPILNKPITERHLIMHVLATHFKQFSAKRGEIALILGHLNENPSMEIVGLDDLAGIPYLFESTMM
jgi:hypothetical protein